MDNYLKCALFTLIVSLTIWDIAYILAILPQGTSIIHQKASQSLIQQESNIQPFPPGSQPVSTTNTQISSRTNIHSTSAPNRRDYVNPNAPAIGQNPSRNNQPVRNQNGPTQSGQNNQPTSLPGRRDYVAPTVGQTGLRVGQNLPQQNSPTNSGNTGVRGTSNGNIRDYVAPQRYQGGNTPRPNFPVLSAPNGVTPTPLSYAQRVAGGITTKSPKSSSTGPPGSSTTEKSDDGPTDNELRDFAEAILRRDINNAAKFVTVNYQGKTTSQSKNDEAPQKLLEIRPEAFEISTISKLKLLHNNYVLEVTENEHVTAQEKAEENDLIDLMLTTPIMQFTRNFLISKNRISKDPREFKDLLKLIWFNMYSRGGGRIGSSAFEHIFLAELKKEEVSGMHNWVYFDQAEGKKLADYLGYMKKIDLGEKGAILKFHFKLNGVDKPVDSMFIGTSPELEFALYTTCYLFRADRICPLRLNGNNFIIRTYNFRYRGKNMIGSAFPEI